jgi:hypothetical protein
MALEPPRFNQTQTPTPKQAPKALPLTQGNRLLPIIHKRPASKPNPIIKLRLASTIINQPIIANLINLILFKLD